MSILTDKEKVVFCRDAFLVIDNIAFFHSNIEVGDADALKLVDTNSKRSMIMKLSNGRFSVVQSSLSEASYYKSLYYLEVNKNYVKEEVLRHAKVR